MENGTNNDFGFTFVGSYLNQCARVEAWTIEILTTNKNGVKNSKVPHLFGQKLKAVRELADSEPGLFSKPARVIDLMQRFEAPAKLRSNLAHAITHRAINDTDNYYLFQNTGTSERLWFTEKDLKGALADLKKLVKEITDQNLKAAIPASSQPLPKQGVASGP